MRGFSERHKTKHRIKPKDYKYKNKININLKPKIIAKHLLANRLFILKEMREIKFRIFDKKRGKIFKAHDLRFTAEEAVYEVCHDTIREDGGKHWTFTDFKEIILMQFTGLKDIEEKEIYEGDIVLGYNNPHVVTFSDSAFYLTYKNSSVRLSRTCGALKIIGNIYENPELTQTTP